MPYDQKCHDLAQSFLLDEPTIDTPENTRELAQDIQTCIEDFIAHKTQLLEEEREAKFASGEEDTE